MGKAFLYGIGGGGPSLSLGSVTISANGTYLPSAYSLDAFDRVDVSIPSGAITLTDEEKWANRVLETYSNSTVTSLNGLFSNQYCLSYLDVPAVTTLGVNEFVYTAITSLTVNATSIGIGAFINMLLVSYISLPSYSWTNSLSFQLCYNLKSITYGHSSIATFSQCYALSSISFTVNPISVGQSAFYRCYGISKIDWSTVTTLGQSAFYTCGVLTVDLPSVTAATGIVFGVSSATDVCPLIAISLSNYSSNVGMFQNTSYLLEIDVPKATTLQLAPTVCSRLFIVNAPLATRVQLSTAEHLKSLYLPAVTLLSSSALQRCASLEYLYLSACSIISGSALSNCTRLSDLYLMSTGVCALGTASAILNTPIQYNYLVSTGVERTHIHVPLSLIDSYKVATNWVTYSSLFVAEE